MSHPGADNFERICDFSQTHAKKPIGGLAGGFRDGGSRNSISIRVVPRKLMPSSLSLRRRLVFFLSCKTATGGVDFALQAGTMIVAGIPA